MTKELHQRARNLIKQQVSDFELTLLNLAETIADQEEAEMILTPHVRRALDFTKRTKKQQNWLKNTAQLLGGTLLGASVSGFIPALLYGQTILIAIFASLGLMGTFLALWGLWR
jgi:hypothetical protein